MKTNCNCAAIHEVIKLLTEKLEVCSENNNCCEWQIKEHWDSINTHLWQELAAKILTERDQLYPGYSEYYFKQNFTWATKDSEPTNTDQA